MHEIRSSILSGQGKPALVARKKGSRSDNGASLGGLTGVQVKRAEARTTNQRSEDRLRDLVRVPRARARDDVRFAQEREPARMFGGRERQLLAVALAGARDEEKEREREPTHAYD